jgi:hypothetical protein
MATAPNAESRLIGQAVTHATCAISNVQASRFLHWEGVAASRFRDHAGLIEMDVRRIEGELFDLSRRIRALPGLTRPMTQGLSNPHTYP